MKFNGVQLLVFFIFILISPDPLLMTFAGMVLFFILRIMWRDNEPKHLLSNMIIYWMVVSVLLPYGAIYGKSVSTLVRYNAKTMEVATWLSITALFFYALGTYLPIRKIKIFNPKALEDLLKRYDARKLFATYIYYSIFAALLGRILLTFSGGQMLMSLVYFKWVFLTFLIIHTLIVPSNKKYVIILIVIEVLLSFSGFWAAFKDYILVAVGAYLMLTPKISWKNGLLLLSVGLLAFLLSVLWSASKTEYRRYLTGGERSQAIVETDQFKNISKLMEIVSNDFSSENFSESFVRGTDALIYRVSYVEFFALALQRVPVFMPHENGNLLKGAFDHVLKPRIFFPDKKIIYDSELTSKYTGVSFSGADVGVSFSLGCVAESYVDFGEIYMFVPIFFFGLWLGWMYKKFVTEGYNLIWGLCYSAPIFHFAWSFPVPTTKFLGWSVTYFVGTYFINRYLIKYLDRYLLKKEYQG